MHGCTCRFASWPTSCGALAHLGFEFIPSHRNVMFWWISRFMHLVVVFSSIPSRSVTSIFNRVGLPGVMKFPPFPHIVHLSPSCRRLLFACLGSSDKAGVGRVWVVCKGHSQCILCSFAKSTTYGTCTSIYILRSMGTCRLQSSPSSRRDLFLIIKSLVFTCDFFAFAEESSICECV